MIAVRPAWDLLPRDAESVVAVSGGPDSTALLVAAAPRRRIVAAHFNHALRGAEADADAAFVADLAARLGVPFVTEKADPPAGPDENRARNARYDFLLRVARSRGCPVVAVAHTADDQAETFLMRLIRGAGTRGLGAMAPSRPLAAARGRTGDELGDDDACAASNFSARPGSANPCGTAAVPSPAVAPVALVRPFLAVRRTELLAYLKKKRVGYRIDPSNFDTTRLRARIRAELLPQLLTYNPRIVEVLCRTAAHMREDQLTLEAVETLRTLRAPDALATPHASHG